MRTKHVDTSVSGRKIWLFVIAITLQNVPEGRAVGVGFRVARNSVLRQTGQPKAVYDGSLLNQKFIIEPKQQFLEN
jgi:hypothetical protein